MKKILLIVMMFISSLVYSQGGEKTPRYLVVDNDTIGVVISIEDAQKLDNDGEILKLYKQMMVSYGNMDNGYLIIVDNLQKQIGFLNIKVSEKDGIIADKDVMITDLKNIIANWEKNNILTQEQMDAKDKIVKNLEKDVRKLKWQRGIGVVVSVVAIVFFSTK